MKLTDTCHADSCNRAACDCPTLGETIAEAHTDLDNANSGKGIPPWMTQEQAIEQATQKLADLYKLTSDGEPLFSTNPDVYFGATLMRECRGIQTLCAECVVRAVARRCDVSEHRAFQLSGKLAECGAVRTEPNASDYDDDGENVVWSRSDAGREDFHSDG